MSFPPLSLVSGVATKGLIRSARFVLCALTLLCSTVCGLSAADTLRHIPPLSRFHYYDPRLLPAQAFAERFDLVAPGTLHAITVTLGGPGVGKCRLTIYGEEGGAPVPRWGIAVGETITIEKTRPGLQTLHVRLEKPLVLRPHQFFIAVSGLPARVVLVGDRGTRTPVCASEVDTFRYQCIQGIDGVWRTGLYAFAISAEVNLTATPDRFWFSSIGDAARSLDSLPLANRSIAWADVNNDHYVDILAGGRLWLNQNATAFLPQSLPLTSGIPQLNLFTDIDNDHDQDVLLIACVDSAGVESSWCLLNDSGSYHTAYPLSFPRLGEPTSFSILNANSDRYPDLAIGTTGGVRILVNTARLDYRDVSPTAFGDSVARQEVRGCAWIDVQGRGEPTLWTLNNGGVWTGWRMEQEERDIHFTPVNQLDHPQLSRSGRFYAGDWADADQDGALEPVLVRSVTTRDLKGSVQPRTSAVLNRTTDAPTTGAPKSLVIPFAERRASCAWADVNMDGRLDLLALTARPCRPVTLMMQQADGSFIDATFEAGLTRFAAGPDAVWVDFDNDQRLDIATIANGRLTILRNTMEARDGFAVDLASLSAGTTLHLRESAEGQGPVRYDLSIGRGQLMQAPQRIVVPIDRRLDTVTVTEPGAGITTALLAALDQSSPEIISTRVSLGSGMTALVSPNPFTTTLDIQVVLPVSSRVRITLVSEEGGSASVIADTEALAGRSLFTWEPRDQRGRPMPYGVYILSIEANGQRLSRKVVYSK